MARSREQNRATYLRRVQLAQERGYTGLGQQRTARAYLKTNLEARSRMEVAKAIYGGNIEGDWWQAFKPGHQRTGPDQKNWFVNVESRLTADEWDRRYPK